jgi:hypothetical protein
LLGFGRRKSREALQYVAGIRISGFNSHKGRS